MREREPKRYEISRVPAAIRNRDRVLGSREAVLTKYERIAFDKSLIHVPGKPQAAFVCPGHPLLDAVIDLVLERYRDLLRQGAILIDEADDDEAIRAMFYLEHAVQDGRTNRDGTRRVVSRQLQFVAIDQNDNVSAAGYAPYLDCRAATEEELAAIEPQLDASWLSRDLEQRAISFAISELVPRHFQEIRDRQEARIDKTTQAVKERLTKEIAYWDHRAQELKLKEEAGGSPRRLNSGQAQDRAVKLQARLEKRLTDLEEERKLSPLPPVAIGGALVIPIGLLRKLPGREPTEFEKLHAKETKRVEMLAMNAVMEAERKMGHTPEDVGDKKLGYDVESRNGESNRLRFIEVKGRVVGAETVTVTRNEVIYGINSPENFILAIVGIDGDTAKEPVYIRNPFEKEPDFGAASVNYKMKPMLEKGAPPS